MYVVPVVYNLVSYGGVVAVGRVYRDAGVVVDLVDELLDANVVVDVIPVGSLVGVVVLVDDVREARGTNKVT